MGEDNYKSLDFIKTLKQKLNIAEIDFSVILFKEK